MKSCGSSILQDKNPAMRRGDDIQSVGGYQRGRVSASCCCRLRTESRLWIDGFDKAWFANGDVNTAGRRVEERNIGRAGNGPHVGDLAGRAIDLHQLTIIARGIEPSTGMIDVEAMRAT